MPAKQRHGGPADERPERSKDGWTDGATQPPLGASGPASSVVTCALGPERESVRTAREFATKTLRDWGAVELCDDVELVVSELVTNALRAVSPGVFGGVCDAESVSLPSREPDRQRCIQLKLARKGRHVMCLVTDSSDEAPAREELDDTPDLIADAGRGLHLVHTHCRRWGWTHLNDSGKVVWALFRAAV